MFKVHQDSELLPLSIDSKNYAMNGQSIPKISGSASADRNNLVHITLCNLHPAEEERITCYSPGKYFNRINGEILTADRMNAYNTFENPFAVKPEPFGEFCLREGEINIILPAKSVVVITLE
jgi:alpha-N-arabinofuranosidase